MGAQGTATIDFGAAPPTDYATIDVTGQGAILATSQAEAWFQGTTTVDSDEEDHLMAAFYCKCVCGIPVAGTGFTIYVLAEMGYTQNTYKIQWVWN